MIAERGEQRDKEQGQEQGQQDPELHFRREDRELEQLPPVEFNFGALNKISERRAREEAQLKKVRATLKNVLADSAELPQTRPQDIPAEQSPGFLERISKQVHDAAEETKIFFMKAGYKTGLRPVFQRGQAFDAPVELARIKQMPKEERKYLLAEFNFKLAEQRSGLAQLQNYLIDYIRNHPEAEFKELHEVAAYAAQNWGIATEEQLDPIDNILSKYMQKHLAVREIRDKYKDDKILYRTIFGADPKGPIQVLTGPMTLCFRCSRDEDFARIYEEMFDSNATPTPQSIAEVEGVGGMFLLSAIPNFPELTGTIMAERSPGEDLENTAPRAEFVNHEEQHAIQNLFLAESAEKVDAKKEYHNAYASAKTDQQRKRIMQIMFRKVCREEMLVDLRGANEILAYLSDGTKEPEEVFKLLTEPKSKGGIYDYLQNAFENTKSDFHQLLPPDADQHMKNLAAEAANAAYYEEYHQLLRNAVDAYKELLQKGYPNAKIQGILFNEPLIRWKRVVRKQLTGN